jgi:hypothetical protein
MGTLLAWHDFFLLVGAAAATLLGLVFVAASIAATIPNEKLGDELSRALWVMPIVYAFLRVLVVSAMGVIPGQTWKSFGYLLLVLAAIDLGRMTSSAFGMRAFRHTGQDLSMADWGWYVVYPTLATLTLAAMGVAFVMGWTFPVQLLAVGMLGHLVIGVHNAWELADWLATRQ